MMRKREEILEQLRELESCIDSLDDSLDDISRAFVICMLITLVPIGLIYILLSI